MLMMTAGDLAFYKEYKDLQKRYKEVIVPKKSLDVMANPTGKTQQRSLYIADPRVPSTILKEITEIQNKLLKAKKISEEQHDRVINAAKEIVVTDGQAFRSLDSHINLMHMLGTWTPEKEAAINRIRSGKPIDGDMDVVLEVQKLFTYGMVAYGAEGMDTVLSPVQHKCSEQVLLPPSIESSLTAQSPTLAALYKIMSDNNIDTIHFTSAVKVGNNGFASMPDGYADMDEKDIYDSINAQIKTGEDSNRSPIHSIPYEYIATVSYVPEHGVDRVDKISTQAQKLISSDIPDDAVFTIEGKKFTKAQILQ
jgi:hypothetical protein